MVWGVGLAYGFVMAALMYLLKEAFAEPLCEALIETVERRITETPIETRLATPQATTCSETFVISDLHIDTWDKSPPIEGKTRAEHFADFLDTIKRTALELYINGDLVDMPPNPAEVWTSPTGHRLFQTHLPKYAPVFASIVKFSAGDERTRTMTMYMAGNHDMSGSGFRYLLSHNWDWLPGVELPFQNLWYGHYIFHAPYVEEEARAQYRYFLEHGHYHDPVLILYLMQFVVSVVSSNLQAAMDSLTIAGQRRRSLKATPPPPGVVVGRLPVEKDSFAHRIVKWRWRWKARRRLAQMNRRVLKDREEPLDGILMGHTHLPDMYVYRLGGVREKVYVNTGDWSGNTGHATYVVLSQDGLVYLYDWHRCRPPHHQLATPQP